MSEHKGQKRLARAMGKLRRGESIHARASRIGKAIPNALKDEWAPGELLRTSLTVASALFDAYDLGVKYGAKR